MQNQAYSFLIFILNGILIGLLFDIFRILRKSFKTPDTLTILQDIFFGITSGAILLYSIFKFNNGELRIYILLGVLIGISVYILAFSKIFIKVSVKIIIIIKLIFKIVIINPIKFFYKTIKKFIFRPISILCAKLEQKILCFFRNKKKKTGIKHKTYKKKKDFAWFCRKL